MAIVEINFMSESLQRNVSIKCIIPDFSKINPKIKKFRSLYLLHGLLGNDYDWITNSNIKMYAEKTDIIVIMPSGENGFYIDDINRHSYYH